MYIDMMKYLFFELSSNLDIYIKSVYIIITC